MHWTLAAVQLRGQMERGRPVSAATVGGQDLVLLDLLDRMVDRGVILVGDLTISVADVDLIYLGLRVLLAPVERLPELAGNIMKEDDREVRCG